MLTETLVARGWADEDGADPACVCVTVRRLRGHMLAVTAQKPLFAGIGPRDPNLIGQSAWWEATPKEAAKPPVGWSVTFTVGWGDCPSGCIDKHTWTYDLGVDGSVTFVSETGRTLPPEVVDALRAGSHATGVGGQVTAGPTSPVQRPNGPGLRQPAGRLGPSWS